MGLVLVLTDDSLPFQLHIQQLTRKEVEISVAILLYK